MSEQDVEQTDDAVDETTDEAPETTAEGEGAETTDDAPEGDSGEAEIAAAVDQRAAELTGADGGISLAGPTESDDPIARAEDHISSLDMNEEREAVDKL